ncbi:hypothetical protein W04_1162 [Pseudoalteromonas sp. SW0106-04]|nr:hypothetical protein W04_1162 [Pseudoalteromonas sp. SW0106-04]
MQCTTLPYPLQYCGDNTLQVHDFSGHDREFTLNLGVIVTVLGV